MLSHPSIAFNKMSFLIMLLIKNILCGSWFSHMMLRPLEGIAQCRRVNLPFLCIAVKQFFEKDRNLALP